jgi:hypothetical protein
MNEETGNAMKGFLDVYVDLIVQKYSNREQAIYFSETHENETYASRGEAIFEHETRSKKNVWYRYFKWDNYSQFFLAKEITKDEVRDILKDVLLKKKASLTVYDLRRFKEFGAEE